MVSVSGSSGTRLLVFASDLAPADVRTQLPALELDSSCMIEAASLRVGDGVTDGAHGEHPAARRHKPPLGIAGGAGVKDQDPIFGWR